MADTVKEVTVKQISPIGHLATQFVWAVILLSVAGVSAIVVLVILRPAEDNTDIITIILGFLVPTVTALLAAAVQQIHLAMNSRLTELLELNRKASKAEGKLEERSQSMGRRKVGGMRASDPPPLTS